jgi:hypothetical protein
VVSMTILIIMHRAYRAFLVIMNRSESETMGRRGVIIMFQRRSFFGYGKRLRQNWGGRNNEDLCTRQN